MSELVQQTNHQTQSMQVSLFAPQNLEHWEKVAEKLSKSAFIPKSYQNNPSNILVGMELGLQLGLSPIQALQSIAVVNGIPTIYGDGFLAVIMAHPEFEWIEEKMVNGSAVCTIKRKGMEPHSKTFTVEMAKKAGLWGKPGPWSQHPDRMLQMRARGFCGRDTFPDALKGFKCIEEVQDIEVIEKPKAKDKLAAILDITPETVVDEVSEAVNVETGEVITVAALPHQIEEIQNLLAVKEFPEKRLSTALKYYKIDKLENLSAEQAVDFIDKLNNMADAE